MGLRSGGGRPGGARDPEARAEGSLPCDLPLDGDGEGRAARLGGRPAGRLVAVVVAAAVLAAALVGLAAARGCAAEPQGAVARSAALGADGLVSDALESGRSLQARAVRGEGLVAGTVCIDPGHGGGADLTLTPIGPGSDEMQYVEPGGASGWTTGREEAEVTLEVGLLLRDKLEDLGVTVVMTRVDGVTPMSSEQRAEIANASGADIFVRLHCDGSDDPSVSGFSTLVPGYNQWTAAIVEQSAFAASIMHPIVVAETGERDLGIVQRTDLAGFNYCQVPSVLFEMGFMSNPEDDVRLSDPAYQEVLAQALCDATVAYLKAVSG